MKEFLRPHWAKLVLPAMALGVFFLLVNSMYGQAALLDRYVCDTMSLTEALLAVEAGDYQVMGNGDIYLTKLNKTVDNETNRRWQQMGLEIENLSAAQTGMPWYEIIPSPLLDPIYPVPCETVGSAMAGRASCNWYISEKTYSCIYKESPYIRREEAGKIPYNPVSPLLLAANAVYLFTVWYLISCLLFFAFMKARAAVAGWKPEEKKS